MIVEDNQANLDLIVYLLNAFGYETAIAAHGRAGLAAARAQPPELIVCDVQMPEMNGYEFAQAMKSDPDLRSIPLVAVTAFAMVGDQEKALAAGFDEYIAKPIEPEDFVARINELLPFETWPEPIDEAAIMPGNRPTNRPTNRPGNRPAIRSGKARRVLCVDNVQTNLDLWTSSCRTCVCLPLPAMNSFRPSRRTASFGIYPSLS